MIQIYQHKVFNILNLVMQQNTLTSNSHSQQYINHIKRLQCQPSQSQSENNSEDFSQGEGERAIQQFKREIEERFKISIANKIYHFPKRVTVIQDLLSSSDEEGESQEQDSQWNDNYELKSKRLEREEMKKSKSRKTMEKQRGAFKKKGQPFRESQEKKKSEQNFSSEKDRKVKGGKKSSKKEIKNESWRQERENNRSKRINTEPDHVNYLDTLRQNKLNKKIH